MWIQQRRCHILIMCFCAVSVFTVGMRVGMAADCYRLIFKNVGCSCDSISCQTCTEGTCQGTRKICTNKNKCESEYPSGFLMSIIQQNPPCYTIYDCAPENGGACSGENPCAKSGSGTPSETTFGSTEHCVASCPGGPT